MVDNDSSGASKQGGLSLAQKIVAAIGAITLVLGAITTLMLALPQFFKAARDAKDAAFDLMPSKSSSKGMLAPGDHKQDAQPNQASSSSTATLGPKPGPNCRQVMFTDTTTIPPTTSVTWKC